MIKLEEQPIVEPKDYLFNTWVKGTEIIETEKGGITVLELLTDFKSHLMQNVEHNKEAYHQAKQCAIHSVVSSCVDKETLIEDLNDKRIVGKTIDENMWHYCRKETAEHLLDKYEIKTK